MGSNYFLIQKFGPWTPRLKWILESFVSLRQSGVGPNKTCANAILPKEHDHHILHGWVGGRSSSRSGRLIVRLQCRCMSKVRSREIWVSDSKTISDGERNPSKCCALYD